MKHLFHALLTIAAFSLAMGPASAADVSYGKKEFMENCAICHGEDGRGGTKFGEMLKVTPPDLTQMAKNNGGHFPFDRVYEIIDGRSEILLHGTRDMPVWGTEYTNQSAEHLTDVDRHDVEFYVQGRIFMLINYLNSIQAK